MSVPTVRGFWPYRKNTNLGSRLRRAQRALCRTAGDGDLSWSDPRAQYWLGPVYTVEGPSSLSDALSGRIGLWTASGLASRLDHLPKPRWLSYLKDNHPVAVIHTEARPGRYAGAWMSPRGKRWVFWDPSREQSCPDIEAGLAGLSDVFSNRRMKGKYVTIFPQDYLVGVALSCADRNSANRWLLASCTGRHHTSAKCWETLPDDVTCVLHAPVADTQIIGLSLERHLPIEGRSLVSCSRRYEAPKPDSLLGWSEFFEDPKRITTEVVASIRTAWSRRYGKLHPTEDTPLETLYHLAGTKPQSSSQSSSSSSSQSSLSCVPPRGASSPNRL